LGDKITIMTNVFKNLIKGLPIFLALMFIHITNAQFVPKNDMEKQAAKLVQAYQADVGMTIEQASAVYEKIAETIVKENDIRNSSATPEEKKKSLTALSKQETEYMSTILDPKQMREYKKLKKTLQPIK
jgi:hypothetical protein